MYAKKLNFMIKSFINPGPASVIDEEDENDDASHSVSSRVVADDPLWRDQKKVPQCIGVDETSHYVDLLELSSLSCTGQLTLFRNFGAH